MNIYCLPVLIVCCSPISRTPSHPHHLITHHTLYITQDHEEEIVRANAERDKRHQMDMYTLRQKMQKEIEETRARELSTGRKFEIEHQGLKMLELQMNDIKHVLDTRDRELGTRERECQQRMRNADETSRDAARKELREELGETARERKHLMHERQVSRSLSRSLSLTLNGLFLYTGGVSCNVEWCTRQLRCSSIILCNIISIAYNHHTDIYPLLNI